MARLIWTERAVSSLEDVYDYIAADSPTYAKFQIERFAENIENLKAFPESGRKLPEYPAAPYREIIVDNCRLIYRYDGTKQSAVVINIVHGRRSLASSINHGEAIDVQVVPVDHILMIPIPLFFSFRLR